MTWSTTAQVLSLTGVTVTDPQLSQAIGIISMACGRDPSTLAADALSTRDTYWLGMACAYQAAWLTAQPDLFTRSSVTSVSQDGQSVSFTPTGQTLAPLAAKAIGRLSWKGTISVRTLGAADLAAMAAPVGGVVMDFDDSDGGGGWAQTWKPL